MKKLLPVLIALLCAVKSYAQFTPQASVPDTFRLPSYADVNSNYRTYANNVFGSLEANRMPTGVLLDYAFDFTEPKTFNGITLHDSTLVEPGIFSELYKTIFTGKFNNTASLRHPHVHDSLFYIARQKNVITLSGLLFKYNAIDPNAQTNGKIDVVNGQLKDKYVSGVWQNPYQEFTSIAITPSIIRFKKKSCSVIFPQNLWLSNVGSTVSSIQFDAGDGAGYRTLAFNTSVSLNYADTGWKHWTFKVNRIGGLPALYTHTKVYFGNPGVGASARTAGVPISARGAEIDVKQNITAAEAYNGIFGKADIIISYHSVADRVIRRPLIVAEGFDPGHITDPEEEEGINDFAGFIRTIERSSSINLQTLLSDDPSTYDIIYVNWRNGTDYLQRNAFVLEAVIRWVNANKQPLAGVLQGNVVLGSSMGGVIARMALGRMDRGGGSFNGTGGYNAHQTRLYISLDAPHLGANVPLGAQAAARHASRMYIASGPAAMTTEYLATVFGQFSPLTTLRLADQPAARQMLINRIDVNFNTSNTDHVNFQNELRTQWAYPVNIRCVAISDGNECAIDQEYTAGSALLYYDFDAKTRIGAELFDIFNGGVVSATYGALTPAIPFVIPGKNRFHFTLDVRTLANGGGNRVYYGNMSYTKKVLWLVSVTLTVANKTYNAPTGLLPLDTYPGGFYTISFGGLPNSVVNNSFQAFSSNFSIKYRFAYVHTPSALDIGGGNQTLTSTQYTARYIGATPPAAPYNTPFVNFTTAFNATGAQWDFDNTAKRRLNNQPHEWFFLRSADWLAAELNRTGTNPGPVTNCTAFCPPLNISGSTSLCTSATYSVPAITNAAYTWTAIPGNSVTFSGTGNSRTATRNANYSGNVTLTVTITVNGCGSVTPTLPIVAGTATPGPISWEWNAPPNRVHLYVDAVPNATSYQWYLNGTLKSTTSSNTYNLPMSGNVSCGGFYYFGVKAVGSCGTSPESYVGATMPSCDEGLMISPNPTADNVKIDLSTTNVTTAAKTTSSATAAIREVVVYDKLGVVRLRKKFSQANAVQTVSLSSLPNDVYTLQVFDGQTWRSGKIVVQH
ncbi:MAG: T9SS type A sorting domain-containing protein [Agriterribacter sp.]